ncbi:MAG: hypothetical protein QOD90_39 [Mycobacterium sp.]|jgi:hypothetical protein|nr:hypothetical protein [Mycobacterium sp.]
MAGAVMIGAMAAAGCGSDSSATAPPPIVTAVSEATWSDGPWPLIVSEGVLRCRYSYQVTFTANGQEYALNRKAVQSGHFADIEAIARPRPPGPFGYVEINDERQPIYAGPDTGSLIFRGLDLCS